MHPVGANYDESKVPQYSLPDPLICSDGTKVTDAQVWMERRRPELLRLFEDHVYGRVPERLLDTTFEIISVDEQALGGRATRKQVCVLFTGREDGPRMDILIYLPKERKQPTPIFVGLNRYGNHTIHADPGIALTNQWVPEPEGLGLLTHQATEAARGSSAGRWSLDRILERGYALATIYCGDLDPDFNDGFQNGVHPLFYREEQSMPAPNEWGTFGAWAWGLSRAMDVFEADEDIDHKRVALFGHSRLGKTALWAGARDERFSLVISNLTGCGGAALSRRRFGETVKQINTSYPYWFCENFKQYNDNEDALPVDQHMLLALIAPRPLYIASVAADLWADPYGEFISAKQATPVYRLFGKAGISTDKMPGLSQPIMNTIGYQIRDGQEDITAYEWDRFMDFADLQFA